MPALDGSAAYSEAPSVEPARGHAAFSDLVAAVASLTEGSTTTSYGYDGLNRLVRLSGPVTASYGYNGDGLRVSKTAGGLTTNYSWDPTGLGVVLSDGPASEYVWG